ncbi:MAG: hypothetical protein Q4C04_02925 [Clostridia bacterium]|nr:hypothetical protein [Clostridia bacterium]
MRTKRRIIREQAAEIDSLNQQIQLLRTKNAEQTELLNEYRAKEKAISAALTEATTTAEKMLTEAQSKADEIRAEIEAELSSVKKESEVLIEVAYQNARDIVKEANEQSRLRLEQTEASIQSYGELLKQFNNSVRESCLQAEENAKRYAEYYNKLSVAIPDLIGETKNLSELAGDAERELPDAEDDPAQLMRNIYTIQGRDIPEVEVQPESMDGETSPDEPVAPEPKAEEEAAEEEASEIAVENAGVLETDEGEGRVYTVDEIAPGAGDEAINFDELMDGFNNLNKENMEG